MKSVIFLIVISLWSALAPAQELLAPATPAIPPAQAAFNDLAQRINIEIARRVGVHTELWALFWNNPAATPQQIADAAGNKAALFFAISAENIQHINNLAAKVGKTAADFMPSHLLSTPTRVTINQDGTVTITPLIELAHFVPPVGKLGQAYQLDMLAVGGYGDLVWTITSGALPPGVALQGTSLTGTPTQAGTYNFAIKVQDQDGRAITRSVEIVINP